MVNGAGRLVEGCRVRVEGLGRGLPDPGRILEEKTQRLDDRAERLANAAAAWLKAAEGQVAQLHARLPDPRHQLALARQQLAPEGRRLAQAWQAIHKDLEARLQTLGRVLESTSYRNVLKRGFAVVYGPAGPVTRAAGLAPGLALELEFDDGKAPATALGGPAPVKPRPARKAKPAKSISSNDEPQGTLL